MAALALQQTRTSLPALRLPFFRPFLATVTFVPSIGLTPSPFNWARNTWQSLLELFPPFLLAVPKKKTSHSRKAMRSANKGLKDKQNLVHCPGCGSPKLAHHLCPSCYSDLNRTWKSKAKQGGTSAGDIPSVSLE
ncbi:hypothetical protein POSPLADRAFT_1129705 [Postia placenta MAD-698-R-SB12]|uniref:Large ribosomal subunit protein bL32m n=1 Tax=Postia placenta MAD-698-R-SB12 TaxID=670580 RepID=A0A1X6NGG5_9APHY|nr:hypothetical protein POSPLADRAFT_1129705 [Postia placenta MAD-698-R-SB12]OSX67610.1 hypothetical protein POSPLADRAFT_1129705 [Postia placenta MAD-698-R-SB12]